MNETNYSIQWQTIVVRIAHIEKLILLALTSFALFIAYILQSKAIIDKNSFYIAISVLIVFCVAHIHVMLMLFLHGTHLIALEQQSNGEFQFFSSMFCNQFNNGFSFGYIAIMLIPFIITNVIAISHCDIIQPTPIWTIIAPLDIIFFGYAIYILIRGVKNQRSR